MNVFPPFCTSVKGSSKHPFIHGSLVGAGLVLDLLDVIGLMILYDAKFLLILITYNLSAWLESIQSPKHANIE